MYNYSEIQTKLNLYINNKLSHFQNSEPEYLEGFKLLNSGLNNSEIEEIELAFDQKLPQSLKKILLDFDMDGIEISKVRFGGEQDLKDFFINQLSKGNLVWGDWLKPDNHVIIASTDEGALAVDLLTSEVYFYPVEHGPEKKLRITNDFEKFLCALVSIEVASQAKNRESIEFIKEAVGCESESNFWGLRRSDN